MTTYPVALSDGLRLSQASGYVTRRSLMLGELLRVRAGATVLRRVPATLRDTVGIRTTARVGAAYGLSIRESLALRTALRSGSAAHLRETLGIRGRLSAVQSLRLRETLRIALRQGVQGEYRRALQASLRLTDTPQRAIGVLLRSTIRVAGNILPLYRAVATLSEDLRLSGVLGHRAVLVAVMAEHVRLADAEALIRAIYTGTLDDAVQFAIDVIEPNGSVTTWAMNARTGAVTEYRDFDFDSFARSAGGTYLAAARDGLYELVGPTDAGQAVIADIVSGLVDFSGQFLGGVKAAYLAVRGQGEFYLKLTSGDATSTVYLAQASSLKTTRINVGKGLRARYFTWELISTGQDFDLTSLNFVALQNTRRV